MKHCSIFVLILLVGVLLFSCVADETSFTEPTSTPDGESRQELSSSPEESSEPSEADESDVEVSVPEVSEPEELPPPPDYGEVNWSSMNRSQLKRITSVGCSYTTPENSRTDMWKDDGVRLTDGVIAPSNGNNVRYSGFTVSGSFVLDLGEAKNICSVSTALCAGNWGISDPQSVSFSVSTDTEVWTELGTVNLNQASATHSGDGWTRYGFSLDFDVVSARYIRYTVETKNHIWIDELIAYEQTSAYTLSVNAIDNISNYAPSIKGSNPVFCGEGQGAIITDMYAGLTPSLNWSRVVVFKPDTVVGQYVITDIIIDDGQDKGQIPVPFEGFIYTVNTGNDWPTLYKANPDKYPYAENLPNYMSKEITESFKMVSLLKVGMRVRLYQVNLVYGTIYDNFGSGIMIVEDISE